LLASRPYHTIGLVYPAFLPQPKTQAKQLGQLLRGCSSSGGAAATNAHAAKQPQLLRCAILSGSHIAIGLVRCDVLRQKEPIPHCYWSTSPAGGNP